jgi:hypothetical protein
MTRGVSHLAKLRSGLLLFITAVCLLFTRPGHADPSYLPGQNPTCKAGICTGGATKVTVGRGFHVFDKQYALFGMNLASSCGTGVIDLEGSWTPLYPATNLFIWGVWASAGYRNSFSTQRFCDELPHPENALQRPAVKGSPRGRYGGGLNLGWRILALDAGYMHDSALQDLGFSRHGMRFRGGIAIAHETFTGHAARYRRSCCKPDASSTLCECERTPVGLALFLYSGAEYVFKDSGDHWFEPLFGVTLKVGLGL